MFRIWRSHRRFFPDSYLRIWYVTALVLWLLWWLFGALNMANAAMGQQHEQPTPKGTIYGTVVEQNGQPAKRVRLVAMPLGVGLGVALPSTRTDDHGKYRFENIPWWGRYTVLGKDDDAGYSFFSIGWVRDNSPEVEISSEHPEAEFNLTLPPKAGFIRIHLADRSKGQTIPEMTVEIMASEKPKTPIFTMTCHSDKVVLVPPDTNLLLHVKSDGFREWDESIANGRAVNLPPGKHLTLHVQLDPSN